MPKIGAMSCLEVRRRILADPPLGRRDTVAHLIGCPPCAEFALKTSQLDAEVAAAFAIPVPAALTDAVFESTVLRAKGRRRMLAIAASFVAATAGAGLLLLERDDPMALAGIDFVVEEEANAILTAKAPDASALTRAVRALRIQLPSQLGDLRYVGTCSLHGAFAHHLIATTPLGKVTLLLLPDLQIAEPGSARARGLRAVVRPAGEGCIAMIAQSLRSLERLCQMILGA